MSTDALNIRCSSNSWRVSVRLLLIIKTSSTGKATITNCNHLLWQKREPRSSRYMGRSTVLLHNKQSTLKQNPAVLLRWDIFQNPCPPFLNPAFAWKHTRHFNILFCKWRGMRWGKKKASGNHTNEVVVKQTTHLGNMLNTFFSLSAKSLQENVLSWCS